MGFQEAFRKLRSGVDAICWIPLVVLLSIPREVGHPPSPDGRQEQIYEVLLRTLASNDLSERSRFFPGMTVAAMRPYEALQEAYIQFTAA